MGYRTQGLLNAAALAAALMATVSDTAPGIAFADTAAKGIQASASKTVLDGVFTTAQADRGDAVYSEKCAPCHEGTDTDGPPLTGTPFIDRWREDTLQGLFDFISTEMPQRAPGTLAESVYLDILAHLLRESH